MSIAKGFFTFLAIFLIKLSAFCAFPKVQSFKSFLVKIAMRTTTIQRHTVLAIIAVPFAWLNFVFLLIDYFPLDDH
jgi:hypothetical protein